MNTERQKINNRKMQHVDIVLSDHETDRKKNYFDMIRLKHRALPECDLDEVDTSTSFLGRKLAMPLMISAMTGGGHRDLRTVNRNLAVAAEHAGVALAVGSQRVMFDDPPARESFMLRKYAPETLLCANLGAVQLNRGFTVEHCREAVNVLDADALNLHLNPLQEAVQPEGEACFGGLATRIGEVVAAMSTPVIVKEVGTGISRPDAELLLAAGVRYVDIAGAGGTSWSRIEHLRGGCEKGEGQGLAFQDWGIPTPLALRELAPFSDRITLIASGGIRSGIDIAKALILGASLCGMAVPFLAPAMESAEAVVKVINRVRREFQLAMFLLGCGRVMQLIGNQSLILEG